MEKVKNENFGAERREKFKHILMYCNINPTMRYSHVRPDMKNNNSIEALPFPRQSGPCGTGALARLQHESELKVD